MTHHRDHLISWNGYTKNKKEWAAHFGISPETLTKRIRTGIPFEKMGEQPPRRKGNYKGRPKGAKDLKPRKPGTGRFPKSEDHKKKISEALKGRTKTEAHIAAIVATKAKNAASSRGEA